MFQYEGHGLSRFTEKKSNHEPMHLPEATISKLATSGYDEGSLETKTSYVTLVLVTHPVCIEIQRREKKTFHDAGCFKTGFLFQRRFHHAIERTWQSVSMQPDGYLKLSLVASP